MSTHPDSDAQGADEQPATGPTSSSVRKKSRRGRRFWIVLGLVAVLCGWLIYDQFDEPHAGTAGGPGSTATTQQGPAAAVAIAYETRSLTGDINGACELEVREALCREVLSAMPRTYTLSSPVTVERTERLEPSPGAIQPVAYDAVIVTRTIRGQEPQRVAFLITTSNPPKIQTRQNIGAGKSNLTLRQLFSGDVR